MNTCRESASAITPVPRSRIRRRPMRSEIGPLMTAKRPTMREYADTRVPITATSIPSSFPIWGRMGERIMVWLAELKTSNQRAKTIR